MSTLKPGFKVKHETTCTGQCSGQLLWPLNKLAIPGKPGGKKENRVAARMVCNDFFSLGY